MTPATSHYLFAGWVQADHGMQHFEGACLVAKNLKLLEVAELSKSIRKHSAIGGTEVHVLQTLRDCIFVNAHIMETMRSQFSA